MKRFSFWRGLCVCICIVLTAVDVSAQHASANIRLKVTDKETGESIPHAVVSVGRSHYITDLSGQCSFLYDAQPGDTLQVRSVGYHIYNVAMANIPRSSRFVVSLVPIIEEIDEVMVRGERRSVSNNVVHQSLNQKDIKRTLGTNMAVSLEQVKGVSTIRSGVTVAKPVVHGMYGNRLLIVNNGVRQQGQQWGDDHAPEVDMNNAGSVQVIKGAEAVRYGAEALGGVIELESKLLPFGQYRVQGSASTLYGTNGRRLAVTADIAHSAPFAKGDWAWRAQGTYINAGDRSTARYILNNTGMREADFSLSTGWKRKSWEADLFYSRFDTKIATLYTAQGGDAELLKKRIEIGQPLEFEPWSRKIDYPYQKVVHHIARARVTHQYGQGSKLQWQAAYQSDHRDEFHQRRNFRSSIPSLSLDLTSIQLDANWKHRFSEVWSGELGAFYSDTDNRNMPGTGVVPIIPNYTQQNSGVYLLFKYNTVTWGAEAGARADHQQLNAAGIDAYGDAYGGKTDYTNLTYSIGGHYRFGERWKIVSNIGLAWRAPHVHELYSNGVEHASGMYMMGDKKLQAEQSTKWITSLQYTDKNIQLSVDAYLQWIDNYIFDAPTGMFKSVVSGTYPIFQYRSTDAIFRGVDVDMVWHIAPQVKYRAGGSMIWANEQKTGAYLPYIPSFRLSHSVDIQWRKTGVWKDIHCSFGHRYVAKQHRFNPASDLIAYSPDAYHLFNAEIGASLSLRKGKALDFRLSAENLFNKQYREYTNRFRYYAHDAGRDITFLVNYQF